MNRTDITISLKKRFAKDTGFSVAIFDEPYFSERLQTYSLIDKTILDKWENFIKELEQVKTEEEYFSLYNSVKEKAINSIKENPKYDQFINDNSFNVKTNSQNLYKEENEGKLFISVDMKKANFSALRFYDASIFKYAETWEEWLSNFTESKHIKNSKYIRQVIMGACNPKKQVNYEAYITTQLYNLLKEVDAEKLVLYSLSNDELIFEYKLPDMFVENFNLHKDVEDILNIKNQFDDIIAKSPYDFFRTEVVELENIGYGFKRIINGEIFELKCVSNEDAHFAIKKVFKLDLTEDDKVFYHNGKLARYF